MIAEFAAQKVILTHDKPLLWGSSSDSRRKAFDKEGHMIKNESGSAGNEKANEIHSA